MKFFHLLGFTVELGFGSLTSVTTHNLFFEFFLDNFRFFEELAGIVCYDFEAFSRGCILFNLEMASFLPKIFKLFFRVTELKHFLGMLARFFRHF